MKPTIHIYDRQGSKWARPTKYGYAYYKAGKLKHARLEKEAGYRLAEKAVEVIFTYGYICLTHYRLRDDI